MSLNKRRSGGLGPLIGRTTRSATLRPNQRPASSIALLPLPCYRHSTAARAGSWRFLMQWICGHVISAVLGATIVAAVWLRFWYAKSTPRTAQFDGTQVPTPDPNSLGQSAQTIDTKIVGCYGRKVLTNPEPRDTVADKNLAFVVWPIAMFPRPYTPGPVFYPDDFRELPIEGHKLFNELDTLQTELFKRRSTQKTQDHTVETDPSSDSHSPNKSRNLRDENCRVNFEDIRYNDGDSEHITQLEALLTCLQQDFGNMKQRVCQLFQNNKTVYDLLWWLFPIGTEIVFKDPNSGVNCAGRILNTDYKGRVSHTTAPLDPPDPHFAISVQFIDYTGVVFHYTTHRIIFHAFTDVLDIGSLPAQPLREGKLKERFKTRGAKFVGLKGKHHLYYDGSTVRHRLATNSVPQLPAQVYPSGRYPYGYQLDHPYNIHATGRVMVDHLLYTQLRGSQPSEPHPSHRLEEVPESKIHLCAPTMGGYSLVSKDWGRFVVDRLSEIVWDDDAFSHLVLDDDTKSLVKSIVSVDQTRLITDFISGKSGGFIIVLHGKPGTGKTLTAEAAAERVRKPLMIVSGAELANPGPGPSVGVERLLQNVFDLAKAWDALVLIDEAEVYLEARSFGDVQRNAMVSIFLRLLEYHHQVVFLTTNHITRLDSAFKSRIAVTIRYPDLSIPARAEIWKRFLERAGVFIKDSLEKNRPNEVTSADLDVLTASELNGRQIKNAVRTVQTISLEKNVPITFALLENVIQTATDFADFEGACECQKRKLGYFGGDSIGSHIQDLKAKWGKIPV